MTSSALSVLPSCHSTPGRSLTVHVLAVASGSIDSAKNILSFMFRSQPTSGWNMDRSLE